MADFLAPDGAALKVWFPLERESVTQLQGIAA
jgi:hypothetical protein